MVTSGLHVEFDKEVGTNVSYVQKKDPKKKIWNNIERSRSTESYIRKDLNGACYDFSWHVTTSVGRARRKNEWVVSETIKMRQPVHNEDDECVVSSWQNYIQETASNH